MQVYVTDAQGLNSFQIAADMEANIHLPFWFPDSKRIGFTVLKRGAKLHWVNADPNAKAKEMNHPILRPLDSLVPKWETRQLSAGR